jgi:hypothetical protein
MSSSPNLRKTPQALAALGLAAALAAALAWYYDVYVYWQPKVFPRTLVVLTAGMAALALLTLWMGGERKALALAGKTLLSVVVFTGVILIGVSALINNVIGHAGMARQAAAVAVPLAAAQILVLYIRFLLRMLGKRIGRKAAALAAAGLAILTLAFIGFGTVRPWYYKNVFRAPVPVLPEGRFAPRDPWGTWLISRFPPTAWVLRKCAT